MAVATKYETIIGIEVRAQLRTNSKMFCSCPTAPPPGRCESTSKHRSILRRCKV